MNIAESKMLDILKALRQEYGALAVKAEFEAEGTRTDELLRLISLARQADLKVALKIGGCEALRDLLESKQFGVEYIIAPMIETTYALRKFIQAKNKAYSKEQQAYTDFLFNLETITAYDALDDLVRVAKSQDEIEGIVFGRVDFVGSNNQTRGDVDAEPMTRRIIAVGNACKKNDLNFVVGGGVSIDSLAQLKKVKAMHLTRFETRKVVFGAGALEIADINKGLQQTVYFELLWLKNKRDYYGAMMC